MSTRGLGTVLDQEEQLPHPTFIFPIFAAKPTRSAQKKRPQRGGTEGRLTGLPREGGIVPFRVSLALDRSADESKLPACELFPEPLLVGRPNPE